MTSYIRAHEAKAGDVIVVGTQGLTRTIIEVRTESERVTIFTRGTQFTVHASDVFVLRQP